jgi:enoyl-CoA hydratase
MSENMLLGSDIRDNVLTVTLYNDPATGYIGVDFISNLHKVIQAVYDNKDIKGVIIVGDGDQIFSKGLDPADLALLNELNGRKFSEQGQELCYLIENCHKPIIAAINGEVMNAGFEIAMACHIRIASENARFSLSGASIGIIPSFGGTQRFPHIVGKPKALELMMTADTISSFYAKELGLVNHVVNYREALLKKSGEILKKIFSNSALSVGMLVDCVNAAYNINEAGYQTEANSFAHCCSNEEFKRRITKNDNESSSSILSYE